MLEQTLLDNALVFLQDLEVDDAKAAIIGLFSNPEAAAIRSALLEAIKQQSRFVKAAEDFNEVLEILRSHGIVEVVCEELIPLDKLIRLCSSTSFKEAFEVCLKRSMAEFEELDDSGPNGG